MKMHFPFDSFLIFTVLLIPVSICSCKQEDTEKSMEVELSSHVENYVPITDAADPILYDTAVYNFINDLDLIGQESILQRNISQQSFTGLNFESESNNSDGLIFSLGSPMDEEFIISQADSAYVMEQISAAEDKIWDLQALHNQEAWNNYNDWCINHYPFNWEAFKMAGFGCFIDLGIPIFNGNHTKAIIYIGYQCHATLGSGSIFRYIRKNGTWEMVDHFNLWIS